MHVRSQKRSYISSSIYVTIVIDTKYTYNGDFFYQPTKGIERDIFHSGLIILILMVSKILRPKMLFFVFLIFSIIELSHQNPVEAQTMMYKCTPDMGINVSMVNCLTNSTSDTYNHSMISEMRQNATK